MERRVCLSPIYIQDGTRPLEIEHHRWDSRAYPRPGARYAIAAADLKTEWGWFRDGPIPLLENGGEWRSITPACLPELFAKLSECHESPVDRVIQRVTATQSNEI